MPRSYDTAQRQPRQDACVIEGTPLKDGEVRLARRDGVVRYPARCQASLRTVKRSRPRHAKSMRPAACAESPKRLGKSDTVRSVDIAKLLATNAGPIAAGLVTGVTRLILLHPGQRTVGCMRIVIAGRHGQIALRLERLPPRVGMRSWV
jgi:hypothetical protein